MASHDRVTSAFAPDLDEIRGWLQKMVAALRFVEMVTAIVALIGRMRDLNTELVTQLAHLRRARPRSEALSRLERQLMLPIEGLLVPAAAPKPKDDTPSDDEKKKRRGHHPGRGAPPAHLPRVPVFNRVPPELRVCPQCGAMITTVSHSSCLILNVVPARVFVEERLDETIACHLDEEWLRYAYDLTRKDGAVGVDGRTAADYDEKLEENLRVPLWRSPSLGRVPESQVPRRRRYYENATTSHARYPVAYGFARRPHVSLAGSCSLARFVERRARSTTWGWTAGCPVRLRTWRFMGSRRFLDDPSRTSAVFIDPGRVHRASRSGTMDAAPVSNRTKAPTKRMMSRLKLHGFGTRCPRFTRGVATSHARPASGWLLAFAERESNPLDRYERFQTATSSFPFPRLCLSLVGRTRGVGWLRRLAAATASPSRGCESSLGCSPWSARRHAAGDTAEQRRERRDRCTRPILDELRS